ncbi:MAG: SDR family NAD(P)-dependent oxidoreductase [Candidatus Thermoplasmatota archaeon]|nr:SDR family NAD(P)-dependent oxidoreductase [Candidatus Thermoplasmatota archaeon]
MKKILVTGGAGFIGSHTVDKLVNRGHDVVVLDNLERQVHRGRKPSYMNPKAVYLKGDVRSRQSWMRALKGVNSVIHLAGAVGVGQSFWQARKYMDVNAGGTATFYEILTRDRKIREQIEKIVVASSKSCYGEGSYECAEHAVFNPEQRPVKQLRARAWEVVCPVCGREAVPVGIREDKPMQNLSPYSLSKYATERLALDFGYALGIPTVALRYFNVYGPRQSLSNPYTGVIAIFLSRLKSGNRPFLFEDGRQLRDYIYVEDVAGINAEALKKGLGVYNVGTGKPRSLLEVVNMLRNNLGSELEAHVSEEFRPGDNRHDFADNSLLRKTFGDIKFTEMDRGIDKLIRWSSEIEATDMFEMEEKERKRYLAS